MYPYVNSSSFNKCTKPNCVSVYTGLANLSIAGLQLVVIVFAGSVRSENSVRQIYDDHG